MASLLHQTPDGFRRYPLGPRTEIGRSPDCDIVLAETSISRNHASITHEQGRFVLADRSSRYGSFVNQRQAQSTALRHGDEVRFGNVVMRFEEEQAADHAIPLAPAAEATGLAAELSRLAPGAPVEAGHLEALRQTAAALEQEAQRLRHTERRAQAMAGMQEALLKCTSVDLTAQSVGPDLVRAVRAERGLLLLRDPQAPKLRVRFAHQLAGLPPERAGACDAALRAGRPSQTAPGPDGRVALLVPLVQGAGGTDGLVYLELPRGRAALPDELDLLHAMCRQLATAVARLSLIDRLHGEQLARTNLSRYLSEQVAEAVVSGRISLNLGGEARTVTVLFVDVRGYTRLSEKLPPEHVLAMLNEYFTEVVAIVKGAQGTVDKFIGDALMAVFGAPNELDDQAVRAVSAAVRIREAVTALRARWIDRPWAARMDVAQFDVGIGVNTGRAVAGNLGSEDRKEYTVIGDAVNVASRLCAAARAGQIVIGPETAEAAQERFALVMLEPLAVKGKSERVLAYEVQGETLVLG